MTTTVADLLIELVMHYLDIYWIVMPDTVRGSEWRYWLDAGALMLVAGVASATWAVRRAAEPAVPVGDSQIAASLEYSVDWRRQMRLRRAIGAGIVGGVIVLAAVAFAGRVTGSMADLCALAAPLSQGAATRSRGSSAVRCSSLSP